LACDLVSEKHLHQRLVWDVPFVGQCLEVLEQRDGQAAVYADERLRDEAMPVLGERNQMLVKTMSRARPAEGAAPTQ
jgi:hypothetical protein